MYVQTADGAGKKRYKCSCGSSFSRSDVLVRHRRTCQHAQQFPERQHVNSEKPSRTKKACNNCARSKLKCNAQNPCQRCKAKSIACHYTRPGYMDRYQAFQIADSTPGAQAGHSPRSDSALPENLLPSSQQDIHPVNTISHTDHLLPVADEGGIDIDHNHILGSHQATTETTMDYINASFLPNYGPGAIDMSIGEDWDTLLAFPELLDTSSYPYSLPVVGERSESERTLGQPATFSAGFQLHQIDSVEGQCIEIRNFLQTVQTGLPLDSMLKYITRDRLVTGIQLYGKYYQPIQPMIHLPTFELIKASPVLLLAMMLVGNCYSGNGSSAASIVQCAIHALHVTERSPCEFLMATPPIASIQAHTLLCQLLVCTKNPTAYQFATLHRARTFSMAERAGLFEVTQAVDYHSIPANEFDWNLWIETEMRRRLAYHIFVDDIGGSIFTRSSAHISPFTFYVDTPCYDRCWVAATGSECLKILQSMPPQPQLALAVRSLRSATPDDESLFHASDCGMLQIIIALHHVLFRAMEMSLDDEDNVPQEQPGSGSSTMSLATLSRLLQGNLFHHDIARIANDLVAKYGTSIALKRANDALDAWRRNWDARIIHDVYGGGESKSSAFSHPLNFWLLAKLFVIVHFFRNHVIPSAASASGQEGEQGDGPDDEAAATAALLVFFRANNESGGSASAKIKVQVQVIDWLSKIRQQHQYRQAQNTEPLSTESFLSQVMK